MAAFVASVPPASPMVEPGRLTLSGGSDISPPPTRKVEDMANTRSAKKAARQAVRRTEVNKARRSRGAELRPQGRGGDRQGRSGAASAALARGAARTDAGRAEEGDPQECRRAQGLAAHQTCQIHVRLTTTHRISTASASSSPAWGAGLLPQMLLEQKLAENFPEFQKFGTDLSEA